MKAAEIDAMIEKSMGGYTHDELQAAFDTVKNPEHWKDVIHCQIDDDDVTRDKVSRAVVFFTGSSPWFYDVDEDKGPAASGKCWVAADGYWIAMGA